MTEKEKMLRGLPYDSRNPELLAAYHRARELLRTYNNLDSKNLEQRHQTLSKLL